MSIDARLRQLEERAAAIAAEHVAGAVELPDDMLARDMAKRLAARVAELPAPADRTPQAIVKTILSDVEALGFANGLARRLAVLRDGDRSAAWSDDGLRKV